MFLLIGRSTTQIMYTFAIQKDSNMASEIVVALVGLFCTVVSGIVTFVLTKRKYNTEVEAQYILNIKDAFETYKNTMKETLETQNKKIEELQRENDSLRMQFNQLQNQMVNILLKKSLESAEKTASEQ